MRLTFSRGVVLKAQAAGALAPAALSFFWEEEAPAAQGIALQKLGDHAYGFEHDELGIIVLSKGPWWTELPIPVGERGLWLSYQGFQGDVWHDGVFGRWYDGQWVDLILPGPAFSWELSRSSLPIDDVQDFWAAGKYPAQKESLILAVQRHFRHAKSSPIILQASQPGVDLVLNMLLFRLAFPEHAIAILPANVAWKRLAQNLNITPLKTAPEEGSVLPLTLGPKEKVLALLSWQQRQSPFIPLNLMASLLD